MKAFVVQTAAGVVAFNDLGELIVKEAAPSDFDSYVQYLMDVESGTTRQHVEVLKKLKEMGYNEVVVETAEEAKEAAALGLSAYVDPGNAIAIDVRAKLLKLAVDVGLAKSEEEFERMFQEAMLEYSRRKLRKEAQKRDLLAVQAIRAIDDIDKTINLYVARLREWYSVHFPELDELVKDHETYATLVHELGHRSKFTKEALARLGLKEELAEKVSSAATNSIGAELSDFDVEYIKTLAGIILDLYELRETLEGYIEAVMKEVAPNVTALVGSKLGARLLSLAGGLEALAKLPASTIQVLGAEKALFRALRTGTKPPKHGVIFQYPEIHKSPRWQRGKIARALAAKLAIAAKVDYFSGRFLGDKFVKELKERIEEVKALYPKPPPKKEEKPVQKKRRGGKRGGRGEAA
ncbi:MAG: C/D box methylation guide ribonucleoprotein complex aNOP56 subunit [Desulfurococcaceae archaeon]